MSDYSWEIIVGLVILVKALIYLVYKIMDGRVKAVESALDKQDKRIDGEVTSEAQCKERREADQRYFDSRFGSIDQKLTDVVGGMASMNNMLIDFMRKNGRG